MRMSPSASPDGLAGRIGEARDDLVAALLEARQAMAGDDRLRAQPLVDRREQDLVQLAPRNRNLRPAIAGGAAARLAPDQLAVLVVERELLGEDAGRGELVAETERGQFADGVGLQVDAVAERAQHRHRVIDAAGDADLMQAQRLRQPGNPAADDDDLHVTSFQFGLMPASRMILPKRSWSSRICFSECLAIGDRRRSSPPSRSAPSRRAARQSRRSPCCSARRRRAASWPGPRRRTRCRDRSPARRFRRSASPAAAMPDAAPRRRPGFSPCRLATCGITAVGAAQPSGIWPASTSFSTSAAPRYGTLTMSILASAFSISMAR